MKQEFEKQDEMKRSAMRAVAALLAIPDAGKLDRHHHPNEFLESIISGSTHLCNLNNSTQGRSKLRLCFCVLNSRNLGDLHC